MAGTYTGGSNGGSQSDPYDAISCDVRNFYDNVYTVYVKSGASVSIAGATTIGRAQVDSVSPSGGLSLSGASVSGTITLSSGTITLGCTYNMRPYGRTFTVRLIVVATEVKVTYIAFGGEGQVYSNSDASFVATAYPTNATDRRLTFSKGSGSSYFSIVSTTQQSDGWRVTIHANSTTVERSCSVIATAMDGSGVSEEFAFTILPEEDPTIYVDTITLTASNYNPVEGNTVTIYANCRPTTAEDRTVSWSIDSGAAELPTVRGTTSVQVWSDTPGTSVIRATARDGGGATETISITWRERVDATSITLTGTEPMSGYYGRLEIEEGSSVDLTATVRPSNTDDSLYARDSTTAFSASVRQTGSNVGTNRYEVTVYGASVGSGELTFYAGNVEIVVWVDVVPAVHYVEDIVFPYNFDTEFKPGENSGSITAQGRPIDAEDRRLTATVVSGAQYAHVQGLNTSASGCTFQVVGDAVGVAVVRVQALDDGGYYEDITFNIIEKYLSKGINWSPLSGATFYAGRQDTATINGLAEETVTVEVVSGGAYATVSSTPQGLVTITGIGPGQITLKATTSDTGHTATVTYVISDEWPYDEAVTITFTAGNYDNYAVWHTGYRIHGGNYSINLQEELTWEGASTIPPYSESTLVQSSYSGLGPMGLASEVGTRIVYMTDMTTGYTIKYTIVVEYAGEWTKTIHFDANLPAGTFLTSPVPDDVVKENTGDEAELEIPTQTPACSGYMFCYWDTREVTTIAPDTVEKGFRNAGSRVNVLGEDVTVTLYAVWFPVTEGMTVTLGSSYGIIVETSIPSTIEVDLELPSMGDTDATRFPMSFYSYSDTVDGVQVKSGSTALTNGMTVSSGRISVVGTPTTPGQDMRFALDDAREVMVSYEITVSDGPEIPVDSEGWFVLDANGGTFPTGQSRVTITVPDGFYRLPDSTVVDRPGYVLSGWQGSYTGSAAMGSTQTTQETWTAQWTVDTRDYDTSVLHAAVRIYRETDEWIDVTDMHPQGGEARITVAENQPGTATFSVVNDPYTPSRRIMSPTCNLWSSGGQGRVSQGMYVRIDRIGDDGTLSYLFDGFITTIKVSTEKIDIECGDWLTFLSKTGATYRRNFYGESRTSALFDATYNSSDGLRAGVSTVPPDFRIDGQPAWKILTTTAMEGSELTTLLGGGTVDYPTVSYTFPVADQDTIDNVSIHLRYMGQDLPGNYTFGVRMTLRSGQSSVSRSWTRSITGTTEEDRQFSNLGLTVTGDSVTMTLELASFSGSGGYGQVQTYRGSGSGTLTRGEIVYEDTAIRMSYATGVWRDATLGERVNGYMPVLSIDGVKDLTDASLYTPSEDRVRIPYITGSQAVGSIMESIAHGIGLIPMPVDVMGGDAELVMFRTGGGYALDYLQKLADVVSSAGRRRALMVRGYTTPVLVASSRHALADAPSAHIRYGGDEVTASAEVIAYSSFAPSITMKNRPNLSMVRGTMSTRGDSESVPIMVAVEDSDSTERRHGMVVENVTADGSVNGLLDAANAAWAKLCESDLDEWEGTVTLPGIRRDMIPASGIYAGSGVCLDVTDSTMGISSARVRARQIVLDYNTCTTQITLTNRSLAYSSGISETTAMARTSADVATGDNSTTLFNTQYVRVKTDTPQSIETSGNTVIGMLSDGTPFDFSNVSVLQLPNGRSVLVATAPPDGDVHAPDDKPYDVVSVTINSGERLNIRKSIRPDYYQGQTLVLNVDFPTQS
ncbi:hypothetical protein JS82_05285 [Methanomassiliicoccaceae archaeon DOK]|nr:hypothetical protein JS82_05285 [Methanomassiliicoccaceae archaeon DOK]